MKKLMMALAAIAMGASALADAQFYEMKITLKTTVTKSGKVSFVACDCPIDDSSLYRQQGTVKIKGVIWGCDCVTIGDPSISSTASSLAEEPYGYIFWNETTKKPMNVKFSWTLLNRIFRNGKKVEGTWTLTDESGDFSITGAGFGTVKDTTVKEPICMRTNTWIPSMNGNVAGWSTTGAIVTAKATSGECSWCEKVAGTEEKTAAAAGWSLCECEDSDERTAASGTWRLKYVPKASAALASTSKSVQKITEVYNFPSYVKSVIE
ncbi:MAG: hypothetical protein K6F50_01150 [Kiritimatiellae bacterium]|nr:hypothetical protein [Kiritimatiellia bacterium]